MAFNVNEFRSQMIGDGARPNLFEVSMPFPAFSNAGNAQQKMTFMCKTAQLPGATLGVVPVQYFGRELKFVGNRTFMDWTISVINDEDFSVRNAFERWMNGINSHALNVRNPLATSPGGYSVDGQVTQFGKSGDGIKKYNFVGLFPTDLTPIDVDWGANDTMEEFSVTLSYQWWESVEDGVV
jgi:hypothetical protein|tara:strand:- start:523 stop:1068 length:546 start_codon:yes stop_codon:yes gene_type:complete